MGVTLLWGYEWNKVGCGMRNVIMKFLIIPQRNEELFLKVTWNTELSTQLFN